VGLAMFLVAAIISVRRSYWVRAGVMLLMATLVKTVALIWLPLLGIDMLRRRQYRAVVISILLTGLVGVILRLTLLPDAAAWGSLVNAGVGERVSESIPACFLRLLAHPGHVGWFRRTTMVAELTFAMKVAFMVISATIAWRLYKRREFTLTSAITQATLLLFVLASPWYRPWYATILLIPSLWLSVGVWQRAAIVALVVGGEISNNLLTGLALDVVASFPVALCLLVGAAVNWWTHRRREPKPNFAWDESEMGESVPG